MSVGTGVAGSLSRGKAALFALLPTLAMLGVAEVVLRHAVPDVEIRTALADGGLVRPYRPGTEADLVSADFRVRYAIDANGFRDVRGRALEPRTGTGGVPRVVALGDSFTEGYGVELDEVWTRRLEATGRYEVFALARMGASPMFHVLMAREYVPRLRPDLAVVQLFDNDLDENRYRHLPREPDGRVGALPERLRPGTGVVARVRHAWDGLALVQSFERLERRLRGRPLARLFVRPGAPVDLAPPTDPPSADRLFPWYDAAERAAWASRFDEHAVLIRQVVGTLREAGVAVVLAYVPHHLEIAPERVATSREANPHYRLLARLAESLAVPLVDGIALFGAPGREPADFYHVHDQHWNAEGHALFAEAVDEALAAMAPRERRS